MAKRKAKKEAENWESWMVERIYQDVDGTKILNVVLYSMIEGEKVSKILAVDFAEHDSGSMEEVVSSITAIHDLIANEEEEAEAEEKENEKE